MITDADRLVWLVRRLPAEEVARVFRDGLTPAELLQVIAGLPADRRNDLTSRARQPIGHQHAATLGSVSPTSSGSDRPATEHFGQQLARLRRRRGMSQVQLAGLLGRSESWVVKVEHGTRQVDRLSVMCQLAAVLDVELWVLLEAAAQAGGIPGLAEALSAPARRAVAGQTPE
jgi:DNA-binding XRE family transcriptional regulator